MQQPLFVNCQNIEGKHRILKENTEVVIFVGCISISKVLVLYLKETSTKFHVVLPKSAFTFVAGFRCLREPHPSRQSAEGRTSRKRVRVFDAST